MTGTVVQFPTRAPQPAFLTIVEAIQFCRDNRIKPTTAPHVDATGYEAIDAYLAGIQCGMAEMPGAGTKILFLNEKASSLDRSIPALCAAGELTTIAFVEGVVRVMRKWAGEFASNGDVAAAGRGGAA